VANEGQEQVRRVRDEVVEVRSSRHYYGGSNDRTKSGERVAAVVDRDGRQLELGYHRDWTEVAPGIEARGATEEEVVRIHRSALPVRVEMHRYHEYISYTDSEHCSYHSSRYWVRYEADETDAA
jgi:hypothetical protein